MSIQKINAGYVQPSFKAETKAPIEQEPQYNEVVPEEKPNHKVRNWSIGLGAAATLIGLGVLGRRGNLGKGLQKFLGGAEKDGAKLGDEIASGTGHLKPNTSSEIEEITAEEFAHATGAVKNGEVAAAKEGEAVVAKEGEAVVAKEGEAVVAKEGEATVAKEGEAAVAKEGEAAVAKEGEAAAAKEAEAAAAKEAEAAAAKEAEAAAAKEGEAAVAKEGEGAAAKEAKEAAQKAYDAKMKDLLQPQVLSKIEEAEAKFGEKAMSANDLIGRPFLEMQGKNGTLKTLENGTQVITKKGRNNKVIEYISKDGNKIDRVKVSEYGQPSYSYDFGRSNQPSKPIDIIDYSTGERMTFLTNGKKAKLHEWLCGGSAVEPEKLVKIQYNSRVGGYNVNYSAGSEEGILANNFYVKK